MKRTTQKYELSFEWRRSVTGYKWEDSEPCDFWGKPFKDWEKEKRADFEATIQRVPGGPYLLKADLRLDSIQWKPLDNPMLFAQFADIEPDAESFLNWADEHGNLVDTERDLGNHIYIFPQYIPEEPIGEDVFLHLNAGIKVFEMDGCYYFRVKADSIDFWIQEYRDLSFAVMLWELSLKKDPRLDGIIEWAKGSRLMIANRFSREKLEEVDFDKFKSDEAYKLDCNIPQEVMKNTYEGVELPWLILLGHKLDAVKGASLYVQQKITQKLEQYPLKVVFRSDPKKKLYKTLQPTSLLSAMWYQFYLAQTGDIQLRRCSLCGKWENMEGHRSTWSKHANCANNDRVKNSRMKKKEKGLNGRSE
jgi:hypothetical protein